MIDRGPLAAVARAFELAGVRACVIGGHAVNTWLEPRFTADIDLTVLADPLALERAKAELATLGYRVVQQVDAPSGPDFIRFAATADQPPLDVQVAKTQFQESVVMRAVETAGLPVATVEDLIVLKLIAHRAKDILDLRGLLALPDLDWTYLEGWAVAWQVGAELAALRDSLVR